MDGPQTGVKPKGINRFGLEVDLVENSQEQYFRTRGGDEYFQRNLAVQKAVWSDHPSLELLVGSDCELPLVGRAAVLGGAGGRAAATLKELLPNWTILNVDASMEAIEFGRQTFPQVEHFSISIASRKPLLAEVLGELDVVLANGVLMWVDRSGLSRAIANIDESLRDGGLLLISDFLPPTRRKNPIRHSPEYYTYKQDYSEPFLSLGTYELVTVSAHVAEEPGLNRGERRKGNHLLKKNLTGLYPFGFTS